jgi:hypothetical protein
LVNEGPNGVSLGGGVALSAFDIGKRPRILFEEFMRSKTAGAIPGPIYASSVLYWPTTNGRNAVLFQVLNWVVLAAVVVGVAETIWRDL